MKKQLTISLLTLLSLAACKKEKSNPGFVAEQKEPAAKEKKIIVSTVAPNYVELWPDVNHPGSYSATFNDAQLYFTNVYYDNIQYPNGGNGIPAHGNVSLVTSPYSLLEQEDLPISGNTIVVATIINAFTDYQALHKDLHTYGAAWQNWVESGMVPSDQPMYRDYIKDSYTVGNSTINTKTARLVHITTGSGWALANADYVNNAPALPPAIRRGYLIDPLTNIKYWLKGRNNQLTSAEGTGVSVVGTYTSIPNTGGFHFHGTFTRADGTTFNFDFDQDLS
jgi:hypothetical protein